MSAATRRERYPGVQPEWAARAVVLSDLRKIADYSRRTGIHGDTRDASDAALSRFLRALGHGAVADQWERVR